MGQSTCAPPDGSWTDKHQSGKHDLSLKLMYLPEMLKSAGSLLGRLIAEQQQCMLFAHVAWAWVIIGGMLG